VLTDTRFLIGVGVGVALAMFVVPAFRARMGGSTGG
jgi:predicted small secreted protein